MKIKILVFSLLIFIIPVFAQQDADIEMNSAPREDNFTYGYGVHGIMIILPVPFVECGFHSKSFFIHGSIGFNLAVLESRVEIAYKKKFKRRNISFFTNYGSVSAVQSEDRNLYGFGIDLNTIGKKRYYRIEIGLDATEKGLAATYGDILPRIGIGWRSGMRLIEK